MATQQSDLKHDEDERKRRRSRKSRGAVYQSVTDESLAFFFYPPKTFNDARNFAGHPTTKALGPPHPAPMAFFSPPHRQLRPLPQPTAATCHHRKYLHRIATIPMHPSKREHTSHLPKQGRSHAFYFFRATAKKEKKKRPPELHAGPLCGRVASGRNGVRTKTLVGRHSKLPSPLSASLHPLSIPTHPPSHADANLVC